MDHKFNAYILSNGSQIELCNHLLTLWVKQNNSQCVFLTDYIVWTLPNHEPQTMTGGWKKQMTHWESRQDTKKQLKYWETR